MDNFLFLRKYLKLQEDIVFDQLIELPFATIGYWTKDSSVYWNYALINQVLTPDEIIILENKFGKLQRNSTIMFEKSNNLASFENMLTKLNYAKCFEDSWMFYEKDEIDSRYLECVKKVENEHDLEVYLQTFDASYQKDDPQNPYGELGEYLTASKETWLTFQHDDRLCYFIAYKDTQPVAVATLDNYQGIGYISNVGSLRNVRGEGFGKAVTLFAVQESLRRKNTCTCLATEEGTHPHNFYQQIGFVQKFSTLGYTKIV